MMITSKMSPLDSLSRFSFDLVIQFYPKKPGFELDLQIKNKHFDQDK